MKFSLHLFCKLSSVFTFQQLLVCGDTYRPLKGLHINITMEQADSCKLQQQLLESIYQFTKSKLCKVCTLLGTFRIHLNLSKEEYSSKHK